MESQIYLEQSKKAGIRRQLESTSIESSKNVQAVSKAVEQLSAQTSTKIIISQKEQQQQEQDEEVPVCLMLPEQPNHKQQKKQYLTGVQQRWALTQLINLQIIDTIDRNQAYSCNYAHFHVLAVLIMLQTQMVLAPAPRITQLISYSLKRLQAKHIRCQLKQSEYYSFMAFVLKAKTLVVEDINPFLKHFLKQNHHICKAYFPYYFNLFALVVNKQLVFLLKNEQKEPQEAQTKSKIIQYSVEYRHEKMYNGSFRREDVERQRKAIEARIVTMYHSQYQNDHL